MTDDAPDSAPKPLTPENCDLRTFEWMKLDVNRLLTSETWILGTAEECKAALTLWCEAWRQVPAASLPDDDRMLAHLSRAGVGWKKIREAVMRSWIKCADGRLYHPVVAEKAREAWAEKEAQRARTEAARLAKLNKRIAHATCKPPLQVDVTKSVTESVTSSVAMSVTEAVTGSRGEERREEKKERKEVPPLLPPPPAAAQAAELRPAKTKPRSQLPENWRPNDAGIALARENRLDLAQTLARFTDYHAARGNLMASWDAAWRTWCRSPYNAPTAQRTGPQTQRAADYDANAARLRELLDGTAIDVFDGQTLDGEPA